MVVPKEVRLGQGPLHAANRLQPPPVLFHGFVILQQRLLKIVELIQFLSISADRRVRELEIWILLQLELDLIILDHLLLFFKLLHVLPFRIIF